MSVVLEQQKFPKRVSGVIRSVREIRRYTVIAGTSDSSAIWQNLGLGTYTLIKLSFIPTDIEPVSITRPCATSETILSGVLNVTLHLTSLEH